ncbi:MAG: 50S ribosomal protein L3 [Deltaproteobacteria bacterium]|nr:50S ribosomal protein L3 [Deltaproteobacteria bacterium]
MSGILGIKVGMSQVFTSEGERVPVTLVNTAGCAIVQLKNKEKDGYEAVQVGIGEKSIRKVSKPLQKHFEKAQTKPTRWLREFKVENPSQYKAGQAMPLDFLKPGDFVDVRGTTKGHGFSGGVKRWSFQGGPGAHGSRFHRRGGSIGNHTYPKHVFKGKKMPGHYGVDTCTVLNVRVVDILKDENLLVLHGAVPGASRGLLEIRKSQRS